MQLKLSVDEPLFSVPRNLIKSFNPNLAAASIPKEDERGRTVDLHPLRRTSGTHLSKNGVSRRTAQAALRHSWLGLTMDVACGHGEQTRRGPKGRAPIDRRVACRGLCWTTRRAIGLAVWP